METCSESNPNPILRLDLLHQQLGSDHKVLVCTLKWTGRGMHNKHTTGSHVQSKAKRTKWKVECCTAETQTEYVTAIADGVQEFTAWFEQQHLVQQQTMSAAVSVDHHCAAPTIGSAAEYTNRITSRWYAMVTKAAMTHSDKSTSIHIALAA